MEKGLTYFTPERGRCYSHFQVKKGKVGQVRIKKKQLGNLKKLPGNERNV